MLLSKWRSLLNLCHLCGFKSPFSVARLQANDAVHRSQMFWIVLMLGSYSFAHFTATIHSGETDSTFSNSICRRCLDLRQSRLLPTVVWTVCRALENDWESLWLFCPEQLPSSCSVRDFGWFRLFDLFSPVLCRKWLLLQGLTFLTPAWKTGCSLWCRSEPAPLRDLEDSDGFSYVCDSDCTGPRHHRVTEQFAYIGDALCQACRATKSVSAKEQVRCPAQIQQCMRTRTHCDPRILHFLYLQTFVMLQLQKIGMRDLWSCLIILELPRNISKIAV